MGLVDHCLKSFPNGPCIAAILIPIPTLKLTPKPKALFCKRPMSLFMINIRGQKKKRKKASTYSNFSNYFGKNNRNFVNFCPKIFLEKIVIIREGS